MAVAINNVGTMVGQAGTSFSSAFSVTAGSNLCALAMVCWDKITGLSITSITYGGVAMTACGAAVNDATSFCYSQIFYLTTSGGLPTGSNTLAISATTGTNEIYANIISFTGVHQTTPVRPATYTSNTSQLAALSLTITSATTDLTVTCQNGGPSGPGTTNQTEDSNSTFGSYSAAHDHCTTPSSSVTHTWTLGGNGSHSAAGFSIQPPAAGGTIFMLGHA